MSEVRNGYTLNLPGDSASWSPREYQFHRDVIQYLPNNGLYLTERHHHSNLYDPATDTQAGTELVRATAAGVRVERDGVNANAVADFHVHRVTAPDLVLPAIDASTVAVFSKLSQCNVSILSADGDDSFLNLGDTTDENRANLRHYSGNFYINTHGNVERFRVIATEMVFNELGNDINTRFEGDNDANLLFLEATGAAGANNVRIGTNADDPLTNTAKLHIFKDGGNQLTLSEDLTGGASRFCEFDLDANADLRISPWAHCTEGRVGISVTPTTKFHVRNNQLDSDDLNPDVMVFFENLNGAMASAVLGLSQGDTDQPFTYYQGQSLNNLTGSFVNDNDVTTRTMVGWIRIRVIDDGAADPIADGYYHIPFYTLT